MEQEYETISDQEYPENLDTNTTFIALGKRFRVTKKRWGVLFLVCFVLFLDLFSFGFFSFINDISSFYFQVSPAVIDLQGTLGLLGTAGGIVIVTLFGKLLSFTRVIIIGSLLNAFAAVLIAGGVIGRSFQLVLVGMFISGNASGLLMTLVQMTATNWFPAKERGKASGFSFASRRLAFAVSTVISTRSMGVSYDAEELQLVSKSEDLTDDVNQRFLIAFTSVYCVIAFTSVACAALAKIFVTESPPKVEATSDKPAKDINNENVPIMEGKSSYSLKRELVDVKTLFTNFSFVIMLIIYTCAGLERPLGTILITSLVLAEFPTLNDQIVGVVLIVGILIGSMSGPLTGQILDKFGKPRLTYIIATVCCILFDALFSMFFVVHNVIGVFVSFLLLWTVRDGMLVCSTHRLMAILREESDSVRLKGFGFFTAASTTAGSVSVVLMRLLLEEFGPAVSVLFPMPFLIVCLLSYLFLWSFLRK